MENSGSQALPAEAVVVSAASDESKSEPPSPADPSGDPERVALWRNVRDALYALPSFFKSELSISGVLTTDLFTFNASLGASIEQQVVDQLNQLRSAWDPDDKNSLYKFERQPQRFPDVILRAVSPSLNQTPLLGIELKGWYVLAKEREPSFRYLVTRAVCSEFDLLVVFPWALSNVVSGSPTIFDPFVIGARYAAEYRNWHWQYGMTSTGNKSIELSTVTHHYPVKRNLSMGMRHSRDEISVAPPLVGWAWAAG